MHIFISIIQAPQENSARRFTQMLFLNADSVFVLLLTPTTESWSPLTASFPWPPRWMYTGAGFSAYSFPMAFSSLTKYDTHTLQFCIYVTPSLATPIKEWYISMRSKYAPVSALLMTHTWQFPLPFFQVPLDAGSGVTAQIGYFLWSAMDPRWYTEHSALCWLLWSTQERWNSLTLPYQKWWDHPGTTTPHSIELSAGF